MQQPSENGGPKMDQSGCRKEKPRGETTHPGEYYATGQHGPSPRKHIEARDAAIELLFSRLRDSLRTITRGTTTGYLASPGTSNGFWAHTPGRGVVVHVDDLGDKMVYNLRQFRAATN